MIRDILGRILYLVSQADWCTILCTSKEWACCLREVHTNDTVNAVAATCAYVRKYTPYINRWLVEHRNYRLEMPQIGITLYKRRVEYRCKTIITSNSSAKYTGVFRFPVLTPFIPQSTPYTVSAYGKTWTMSDKIPRETIRNNELMLNQDHQPVTSNVTVDGTDYTITVSATKSTITVEHNNHTGFCRSIAVCGGSNVGWVNSRHKIFMFDEVLTYADENVAAIFYLAFNRTSRLIWLR